MACFVMCAAPSLAVSVCGGPTCSKAAFSRSLPGIFQALSQQVEADVVGCLGECGAGPNVCVAKSGRVKLVKGVKSGIQVMKLLKSYDVEMDKELETWLVEKAEADSFFMQGEFEAAVDKYEKVAKGVEKWTVVQAGVLANWARGLLELKQWERAESVSTKCIAAGGNGWRWKATALEKLGRTDEAVDCLRVLEREMAESERKEVENWRRKLERRGRWFW